jgi:hypothetical protein
VAFVTNDEPAEVLKPSKQSFDFPASAVSAQTTPVLRSVLAIAPVRRDYFDSVLPQFGIQLVRIISIVTDQILGSFRDGHLDQSRVDKLHLMRRRTFNTKANRQTVAICHSHDLGSLATLRLPDFRAPFLADAKLPSMNASRMSRKPLDRKSAAKASNIPLRIPDRTHCWKRRWQV